MGVCKHERQPVPRAFCSILEAFRSCQTDIQVIVLCRKSLNIELQIGRMMRKQLSLSLSASEADEDDLFYPRVQKAQALGALCNNTSVMQTSERQFLLACQEGCHTRSVLCLLLLQNLAKAWRMMLMNAAKKCPYTLNVLEST